MTSSSSAAAGSHNRKKQTCMCSPTTHPGSFRCSLHKNVNSHHHSTAPYPSNRLNARRSAMTNSLVRIGTVEGDLVKRALAALIRPSSHQQRRRVGFQPRRSRLSVMSKAEEHLWCSTEIVTPHSQSSGRCLDLLSQVTSHWNFTISVICPAAVLRWVTYRGEPYNISHNPLSTEVRDPAAPAPWRRWWKFRSGDAGGMRFWRNPWQSDRWKVGIACSIFLGEPGFLEFRIYESFLYLYTYINYVYIS